MKALAHLSLLVIGHWLVGCSLLTGIAAPSALPLLPFPSGLEAGVQVTQRVRMIPPEGFGEPVQMLAVWVHRPEQMTLVGMSEFGVPFMILTYENGQVQVTDSLLEEIPFNPDDIVAQLQFAYWDAKQIQVEAPWSFDLTHSKRVLSWAGQPYLEVTGDLGQPYEAQRLQIINHQHHFTLSIETLYVSEVL